MRIKPWLLGLFACLLAFPSAGQAPFFPFGAPSVSVDPPPPWVPGQLVRFEVTIDRFRAVERDANGSITETQFFHGLGLEWADCWTEVQLGPPPPTRYTEEGYGGQWLAVPTEPPAARCKGMRRFPGFYFDGERTLDDRRIALDGNPANNYGDGLRDGFSLQGPWTFRWTARIRTCTGGGCSLDFNVYVLPDGETGSWNRLPPNCTNGGQPPLVAAEGLQGPNLHLASRLCWGEAVEIACRVPDEAERVRWRVSGAQVEQEDRCFIRLNWTDPGPKLVIRERLNSSGQVECLDSLRLLYEKPKLSDFSLSADRICGREAVEARLVGEQPNRWRWRSQPQALQVSDEDTSRMQFIWLEGGHGRIILEVYEEACDRWLPKVKDIRIDVPIEYTSVVLSSGLICTGEAIEVQVRSPEDTQVEIGLPGSAVGTVNGAGPHQVLYNRAGVHAVIAAAKRGTCRRLSLNFVRVLERHTPVFDSPVRICKPLTLRIWPRNITPDSAAVVSSFMIIDWRPRDGLLPESLENSILLFPDSTTTYQIVTSNGACTVETSLHVEVIPELQIEGLPELVERCIQGAAVPLEAKVTGGLPPYTYKWEPPTQLNNPYSPETKASPNRPTLYRLEVVDSAGCRQSAETAINILHVPIISFDSLVYRCGPQSPAPELRVVVPANANYSYQWLPPDGLSCSDCPRPTVVDTANRSYEVLLEDRASGCTTRVGPIQFQYVQRLRAEAGTDARICKGSSIRIGANIQQPIEVEYRWQPSTNLSNPRNPTPLAAPQETTTYTLTVTATGCPPVEDTVRIEVVPQLELQAVADRMRLCAGDSVRLGIDGLANAPAASWQWLPNLDLSSDTVARPWAKPSMSRTYTLVVQGVECPPLEPIEVELQVDPLPAIELGADSLLVCPASVDQRIELPTHNLDGRTYAYRWEPAAGLDAPFRPNPTARPTNPTVYRLTATDVITGCQFNDSIWVGVGPFVEASLSWTDSTICRGDSLAIVARGGVGSARYLWQPAEFTSCSPCASPFLKPERSTTFTVLADEGGCTSTARVEVRVVPRPVIDFQPNPKRGCVPLAVTMAEYGRDIRSWFWDFGDGNTGSGPSPQHVYRTPGRYRVRLLAMGQAGACSQSDGTLDRWVEVSDRPQAGIVWSSDPPPIVDGPPVRLRSTGSDTLEACHWNLGDGRWLSGCEVWASWPAPGEYIVQLTVRNAAGCVDTASIRLQLAPAELSEIPTVFTPNGDGVNDIWQPQAKTGQDLFVQIYDRNGREVFSGSSGWNGTMPDGSEAEPGTYTFLIRWNGRWYRGWLVLIR